MTCSPKEVMSNVSLVILSFFILKKVSLGSGPGIPAHVVVKWLPVRCGVWQVQGSGCLRRLPTQRLQTAPFPAPSGPHSQTCILVSVTEPQSHLAWAQVLSLPTPKRALSHKRAELTWSRVLVESKGGTMDFISIQQLVRM